MSDLRSKTILITGATDGIGRAAANEFARRGARLVLVGRSKEKTESVVTQIVSETRNQQVSYLLCDLSRIGDISQMAEAFKNTHGRLDVLVNNAGATFKEPIIGPDGYELTFALNHLAYFHLTNSLIELIRDTPYSRVVSTSSAMQARGRLDINSVSTSLQGSGPRAYATSKLCNVLFTKALQRRLAGTSAIANCFEPGSVRTQFGGFGSDQGFFLNLVYALAKPFSSTPEQGADSLIWLATSPEARLLKGQYISKRRAIDPQVLAQNVQLSEDLWELSEKLCSKALQLGPCESIFTNRK